MADSADAAPRPADEIGEESTGFVKKKRKNRAGMRKKKKPKTDAAAGADDAGASTWRVAVQRRSQNQPAAPAAAAARFPPQAHLPSPSKRTLRVARSLDSHMPPARGRWWPKLRRADKMLQMLLPAASAPAPTSAAALPPGPPGAEAPQLAANVPAQPKHRRLRL